MARHLLNGADRHGGQRVRDPGAGGGAGRLDFAAAGVHSGGPDRPQRHGHRPWGIKDGGGQRRLTRSAQHALAKGYRGELGGISVHGIFRHRATVNIVKKETWQTATSGFAIIAGG